MRHYLGLLLALISAAAVFFGAGWGVDKIVTMNAAGTALNSGRGLLAVGAIAGTGLLLGITVLAPRISPLAPGLPGLVLLGWTALYAFSRQHSINWIPLHTATYSAGFRTMLLTGTFALVGPILIIPLVIPSRWRRRMRESEYGLDGDIDGDGDFTTPTAVRLMP